MVAEIGKNSERKKDKLGLSRAKLSTAGVEYCKNYVTLRLNVKVAFGLTRIN